MQLGKASAYGIFGTLYLSSHQNEGLIKGKQISKYYGLPLGYLLWSLQRLARAGILTSARGTDGGFALGRPPHRITLLEIIETLEGPVGRHWIVKKQTRFLRSRLKAFDRFRDGILDHARARLGRITIRQLMS